MSPEVMTADEVAVLMRCDRKTIYEAVLRGTIPHGRLGRRVFFSRVAILDWLATKKSA